MSARLPPFPWFPGYTVAAVATLAYVATAPGQTFVLSQLNGPLRATFGIGELALNGSYTLATVAAALPLVFVGRWTDRIGPRRALAWTALACGLACVAMSLAIGPLTVFLGFFLLRFCAQGSLALISQHTLAMWFHRRLGALHGAKQVVVFGLWILAPQLALFLITELGWRQAYVLLGIAVAASVMPAAWFLVRDRPEELGLRMDGDDPLVEPGEGPAISSRELPDTTPLIVAPAVTPPREPAFTLAEAARTRAYWALVAAAAVPPLIGTALLFDIQPILAAHGQGAEEAARAVSTWSAVMCLMALPAGILTDRARPRYLLPLGMASIAGSALVLAFAQRPLFSMLALALLGLGQATTAACSTATLARYFGRRHHGAIRSSVTRLAVIGTGLGPLFTGLGIELAGSYRPALLVLAGLALPVILLTAGLRAPLS